MSLQKQKHDAKWYLKGIRGQQEKSLFNMCPRCGTNVLHSMLSLNCVSKLDNRTYICNTCGKIESSSDSFKFFTIEHWDIVTRNENKL